MRLPGGVWHGGERRRDFAFRPLTGEVELAMAEPVGLGLNVPEQVTAALAAALAVVGGRPASRQAVRDLYVGDRQFLARQLAADFGSDAVWLTAGCGGCGQSFDFQLRLSSLPVKEIGDREPRAAVETSLGTCRLRPPTGGDQEAVAAIEDDGEALRELVARCLESVDGEPVGGDPPTPTFDDDDLAAIEEGLEAVAPEVALTVRARCPECGDENDVWVDPYLGLRGGRDGLLTEIHNLAVTYGWSEESILRLPRGRRRDYLGLIDRARGMVQ